MSDENSAERITRDQGDANYTCGQRVTFTIELGADAQQAHLCLSNDGYQVLLQQPIDTAPTTITSTLEQPGVLRCRVNFLRHGEPQSMICAAAYESSRIEPTTTIPDDFDAFWQRQKQTLAGIGMDTQIQSDAAEHTEREVDFSKVTLANTEDTRVYGYFGRPSGQGPCPAILTLQNHGGGAWSVPRDWATNFAQQGFLSLAINTHNVDNGLGKADYDQINRGPLASYTLRGFMDRDRYYFKSVYTRLVRAIDYLTSREDWDGKTMILTGRSQGGGLSLVGAGLDPRVTGIVCAVPAMCEHGGHKFGRPAGWPRFVPNDEHDYGKGWMNAETGNGHGPVSDTVWQVSRYYDAVNFARRITCPAVVNLGLIDTCVPPTTVFSALQVIQGSKTAVVSPDLGHDADRNPAYRRDEFIRTMARDAGSVLPNA